jgi:hypothetical protein
MVLAAREWCGHRGSLLASKIAKSGVSSGVCNVATLQP